MGGAKPWREEDSFWEIAGPVLFTEQRWEYAPREVGAMVSLLGLSPGARVLDMCCGVGRHSLEFARRGFRVTGVDRTGTYLDENGQRQYCQRHESDDGRVEQGEPCDRFPLNNHFDSPLQQKCRASSCRRCGQDDAGLSQKFNCVDQRVRVAARGIG